MQDGFVPDTIGTDIAELYSGEKWYCVVAYGKCYNTKGNEIGEIVDGEIKVHQEVKEIVVNIPDIPKGTIEKTATIPIPIPRHKIIPTVIADDLIGVQPMAAPTGQIFKMKHVYDNTPKKLMFTKRLNSDEEAFFVRQKKASDE